MTIYSDPSFLVSWLYKGDINNAKARAWFTAHQADDWLLSDWSRFETANTLRGLCLRNPGPNARQTEALVRYFKHLLRVGPFDVQRVDWDTVIQEADQISAAHSARVKARSADVMHVAILDQLQPDAFVTFDGDQAALALARGHRGVVRL